MLQRPTSVLQNPMEHQAAPGGPQHCGVDGSPDPSGSRLRVSKLVCSAENAISTSPLERNWSSISERLYRTEPELRPDAEPSAPESLSSVHPDETNVRFAPPCPLVPTDDATISLNQTFRHSFWKRRRSTTLAALTRQGVSLPVRQRFCYCGSTAWVLRDPDDSTRFRLATNRCRNRWCEACSRDRRRIVVANLRKKLEGRDLRLLTMTMIASSDPLAVQLDRLYRCFRIFRHRRRIRDRMTGGIYFLELTYNERTIRWHPHLHIIFSGGYLPHVTAKETWLDVTGDSYIVDLRSINGAAGAASYVAKYATKSVNASVWAHSDRLDEAMAALAHRRTFQTFGDWRELNLSHVPDDDTEWEPMCPLATLIREAQNGNADSRRILSGIANNNDLDPLDLPQPLGDSS